MTDIIKPKARRSNANAPTTAALEDGEFAINVPSKTIYYRDGENVVSVANFTENAGPTSWGDIGGDLDDQTDLADALSNLVSVGDSYKDAFTQSYPVASNGYNVDDLTEGNRIVANTGMNGGLPEEFSGVQMYAVETRMISETALSKSIYQIAINMTPTGDGYGTVFIRTAAVNNFNNITWNAWKRLGGSDNGSGGTVNSISAGNGMNFSTITDDGAVALGTPSSITLSSSNGVSTTSHTHNFAPGGTIAQYIRGNGTLATFPTIPTSTDYVTTSGSQTDLSGNKSWTGVHRFNNIRPNSDGPVGCIQMDGLTDNSSWFRYRKGGSGPNNNAGTLYSAYTTDHWFVYNDGNALQFRHSTEASEAPSSLNATGVLKLDADGVEITTTGVYPGVRVARTNQGHNALYSAVTSSGTVYFGHGAANSFTIGDNVNQHTPSNNWLRVTSAAAFIGDQEILHKGNVSSELVTTTGANLSIAGEKEWIHTQRYRRGNENTQSILHGYGWNNSIDRWRLVLEPNGSLAFWAYNESGGSSHRVLHMETVNNAGTDSLTFRGNEVFHEGNLSLSQTTSNNTVVQRTASGDIHTRLFRSDFGSQTAIGTGASLAFRNNDSSDNYIRFCSNPSAVIDWLGLSDYVASSRSISAGNGLSGGGNLTANRTITLGTPGTLSGSTANSVSASSHTHALDTQGRFDDSSANKVLTTGSFGLGATAILNPESDDLNTVNWGTMIRAYRTTLNSPSGTGVGLSIPRDGTSGTQLFVNWAASPRLFIRNQTSSTWNSWVEFATTDSVDAKADAARTITAGNGLSGGGSLAANRTITLATPAAVTLSSTNSVGASNHTHAFTPGGTTSQYIRGNGTLASFPSIPTSSNFVATSGNQTGLSGNKTWTGLHTFTGSSVSWGANPTGGVRVNMGTASAATWMIHGWSGSTRRFGIQVIDNGGSFRIYLGTSFTTYSSNGSWSASDFAISSDSRLKADVTDLMYRGRLRPVSYTLKSTGEYKIGFIADEVQELYPELVTSDDDGYLSLSYNSTVAVVALQANRLEDEVVGLKGQVEELSNENRQLRERLERIEAMLLGK